MRNDKTIKEIKMELIKKNQKDLIDRWRNSGLLEGISDKSLEVKIANSLELAANIILDMTKNRGHDLRPNADTVIFPMIRKILSSKVYIIGSKILSEELCPLHENFEFDEKNERIYILYKRLYRYV